MMAGQRDGDAKVWLGQPLDFANGMALSPDRGHVYVAESRSRRVRVIDVTPGTSKPGASSIYAELGDTMRQGLYVDSDGVVYVGCYEPSRVLRIRSAGVVELLAEDPTAHTLCHPRVAVANS